jgi:hypothetical protein
MPTTRPRYQITDTGKVSEMLDLAAGVWPDKGRKELLLALAELGRDELSRHNSARTDAERRGRQRTALERGPKLVDVATLLADGAWR